MLRKIALFTGKRQLMIKFLHKTGKPPYATGKVCVFKTF